jgi:myo-inositol-1-phosphate synthase
MGKIAIGIVGVGNCASSLLQGIEFYRAADEQTTSAHVGLMHWDLCGYRPSDIEVVCAFDVDQRKVGQPLDVAALAPPNNTRSLYPKLPRSGVVVEMGPVPRRRVRPHARLSAGGDLRRGGSASGGRRRGAEADGARSSSTTSRSAARPATEHYARRCLEAGRLVRQLHPVFVVSDPQWGAEFERRGIPVVGGRRESQSAPPSSIACSRSSSTIAASRSTGPTS